MITMAQEKKKLALIASKGTLDMAYPPMILATTAAAMDWEVGIFFTFYGLNLINKKKYKKRAKLSKKPQFSDPSYFGHKRKPKKRPPGKKKFCKACEIVH